MSPSSPPAVFSYFHSRGLCVEGRGGVSQGRRTAPGDGAGGDAAARRGWRRGRSRRLRQSERSGGCGEPTGPGCAVFVSESGAPEGDRLRRCFCMICVCLYTPSDHRSEVARAGAVRCSCALFNELSHASFIGASTAVLSKLPHSNCCERVPSRPLRGRRGRFPWPLGQGALKV